MTVLIGCNVNNDLYSWKLVSVYGSSIRSMTSSNLFPKARSLVSSFSWKSSIIYKVILLILLQKKNQQVFSQMHKKCIQQNTTLNFKCIRNIMMLLAFPKEAQTNPFNLILISWYFIQSIWKKAIKSIPCHNCLKEET